MDKVGEQVQSKPMLSVKKLLEGDKDFFDLDEDGVFDLSKCGLQFTDEESAELQARKDSIRQQVVQAAATAFEQVAKNVKRVQEEHQKAVERMAAKRRRTDESNTAQPGAAAATASASAPGTGPGKEASQHTAKKGTDANPAVVDVVLPDAAVGTGCGTGDTDGLSQRREAAIRAARSKAA